MNHPSRRQRPYGRVRRARALFVAIAGASGALGVATLSVEGISYIDLDTRDPQYRLSEFDYHNSATANPFIATRLVVDLGIVR